ncbi:MAG: NUDIX hydrolase [bacterium]
MNKPIRDAVSVIIKNDKGETLFALRNRNEDSFPLVWSLPSHFVKEGESFEQTVERVGHDKLGVSLKVIKLLNEGKAEREDFIIFMHDYLAEITYGAPHIVPENPYEEMKWEKPDTQLSNMKVMGDCCRLYKEYLHL